MFFPTYTPSTALNKYEDGENLEFNGICRANVFYTDETGYGVYHFETVDEEKFKIQGIFTPELIEGQTYKMQGKVITYKGEKQLRVKEASPIKPLNKKGIIAYLQTLYGLKSKAEVIYDTFGDDSINVLMKDPMLVAKSVKGIGKKSVVKWQEQLKKLEDNQNLFVTLLGYGISHKNASKLLEKYGESIVDLISKNPYLLMKEVKGYGFLKCDKIALGMGITPDDSHRIRASVKYVLENSSTKGHCFLPLKELILNILNLLELKLNYKEMTDIYFNNKTENTVEILVRDTKYEIDIAKLEKCINEYDSAKTMDEKNDSRYIYHDIDPTKVGDEIHYLVANKELVYDDGKVYLKKLYFAEIGFAKHIKRLAVYENTYKRELVERILDKICKEKGFELEHKQREACIEFNLSESGVYILNGSAGTGKTFTFNLILEVARELDNLNKLPVLAVAPTGKASKVASKSIGMECLTIHRALGFNPMEGFMKNEYEPFDQKVIACDEGSMIDIELGCSFVKAIQTGAKLFILGDTKQLPSVGAGNVLKDMIESGTIKVVTLDVIKRQGLLSGIVENANRIIDSKMIYTSASKDFYVLERMNISDVQICVRDSVKRILRFPDYTLEEIQILLPQRTGSLGVNMFNYLLQAEFNPFKGGERILKTKFEARLNENTPIKEFSLYIQKGDKVMHIKNNYTMKLYEKDMLGNFRQIKRTGITNGESGVVEDIYKIGKTAVRVVVRYEDYYAYYDDGVDELELSFATTIHKSQGSAWKAVILPVVPQHTNMLSNNLLYTGITRARDFCVVVGDPKAIFNGIRKHDVIERYTALANRISA